MEPGGSLHVLFFFFFLLLFFETAIRTNSKQKMKLDMTKNQNTAIIIDYPIQYAMLYL